MSQSEWKTKLKARLEQSDLHVDDTGDDQWAISRGGDPFKSTATVNPQRLVDQIDEIPEEERADFLAAMARGIHEVLFEPDASDADDWPFERAAESLLPTLERPGFAEGASEAAGDDIWTDGFEDDLVLTYRLLLDAGKRVLTTRQVERWKATGDRVSSAARSLLFHRSRNATTETLSDHAPVERLIVGDGHDAARLTVLEDLMFGEFDTSSRIAIPTPDDLLFVREGDRAGLKALREATNARYHASGEPLTTTLFKFSRSKPVPAD